MQADTLNDISDKIGGQAFPREAPIACPLCGTAHTPRRIDVRFGMFASVAHCDDCRLGYQTPRPSEAASAAYMNQRWQSSDAYVTVNERKKKEARKQLKLLRQAAPDARTVLDFGAGSGMFVRACRDAGITAEGVELSGSARARALSDNDVMLTEQMTDDRFDVITMWDVVEHLRDVDGVLRMLRERLNPGGLLILETGNFESWQRTFQGDKWGLYLLDHQFYFTPTSLGETVRRSGFSSFSLLNAGRVAPSRRPWAFNRNPFRFLRAWRHYRSARNRWPEHGDIGVMIGLARM